MRTNACDSLSTSSNIEIIPLLFKSLSDRSELVRGYAALSIAEIAVNSGHQSKDIADKLEKYMIKEKSKWTLICYYEALYILGEEKFFPLLIKEINNRNYIVQICAISALKEIKNSSNHVEINHALTVRSSKPDPISVKDAIRKALENETEQEK